MRLYNEWEAENEYGSGFSSRIHEAIRPILQKYINDGADGRDMIASLSMTVTQTMAEMVLRRACDRRKTKREAIYGIGE